MTRPMSRCLPFGGPDLSVVVCAEAAVGGRGVPVPVLSSDYWSPTLPGPPVSVRAPPGKTNAAARRCLKRRLARIRLPGPSH